MTDPLQHVIPPTAPEFMNIFKWDNTELQKWVTNATKMQDRHVADNSTTKYYEYKQSEFDAIQLRICMILFGMKNPAENQNRVAGLPKGTPGSLLKAYSWIERKRARDLQIKISKDSDPSGNVFVNCIYVSVAFSSGDSFNASENPVFVFKKSRKYMDAGGRVYENWDDYLRNNHFEQGVMIYPENGTYTPEEPDGKAKEKVQLIANETHSCKPSARVKNFFDTTVAATGLLLAGAAVVTAVPLGIFAASTLATVSTGSYYIGLFCTVYSVTTNGFDKFTHDESVATEALLVGTMLLSNFTTYLNQYYSKQMAELVQKTGVWDDVIENFSLTKRILFATVNLIKVALSASSILTALWHLLTKKNRTWLDYYQLCISIFFFANVVTKPITLQAVFESENGKFIENFNRNVGDIRSKVHREEATQELDKAVEKAKTNEQKTYLIRNLQKIEDLDGHFYRVHQTESIVEYTEKGLVINNQITLAPEAYNQMGKEQLLQKLNDIKQYPTPEERNKYLQTLIDDYKSPDFEEMAKNYVNGTLTPEQQTQFEEKIKEMGTRRKDQFFGETAKFKDTPQYRDNLKQAKEAIGASGNVEVWTEKQTQLDQDKKDGKINQQEYQRKTEEIKQEIQKAEHARQLHNTIDKYVQTPASDKQKIVDEYVKKMAGGKNETQWAAEREKIQKQYDRDTKTDVDPAITNKQREEARAAKAQRLVNDPERFAKAQQEYTDKMANASRNEELAKQAGQEIEILNERWVEETKGLYATKINYESNERYIWHVTNDTTKTSIEETFGVSDYQQATVNEIPIFKDMGINTTNDMDCIIGNCGEDKLKIVNIARKLAENPACKMKVNNPREFNNLMSAVRLASGENLTNVDETAILNKVNTMYDSAANVNLQAGQMEYTSTGGAAVHAFKHKQEWGMNTTTEEYLGNISNTIVQPENTLGSVYTQDGQGISTDYGVTQDGRYRFGVTTSDVNGNNSRIVTVHERSNAGVGNPPTGNTATSNSSGNNPGTGNAANSPSSQSSSLISFLGTMSWVSGHFP